LEPLKEASKVNCETNAYQSPVSLSLFMSDIWD